MQLLETKTHKELVESLLAEVAKAKNEVACARRDLTTADNRLNFSLVLLNELITRTKD